MDDENFENLKALRYRIFGAQRDLIERSGGYKRVMEITGRSKSEVCRWQGGADQDFMPPLYVYLLERDCQHAPVTTVMADANGRRLSEPGEERVSQVNVHRAYAERKRREAEVDGLYAAVMEDGDVSPTESELLIRAAQASDRAGTDFLGALAVVKARGRLENGATLRVVGNEE